MEKTKIKGRIYGTLTQAQKRRLKKVRELIAEELPDLIRRNQLAQLARKEKTFSGLLRRAIHDCLLSPQKIADRAKIPCFRGQSKPGPFRPTMPGLRKLTGDPHLPGLRIPVGKVFEA